MTLQNLLAIKSLQQHQTDRISVLKLLDSARRNLADARVDAIGNDNRFDAAYKCIMQCSMLGLWAHGYRTATSQPGHHQTAIQCLTLTMGVEKARVIVLDGLRRQRNINDYVGDPISNAALASCITQADELLSHTSKWLQEHHPELADQDAR
jgi:hypothetical protein